jgi:16S rRNA (cytosine967-C5)-methyltransferase
VLADVPCSGLGALRRRPESRWRRSPDDLPGLGELQRTLLHTALDSCAAGGVVGYVTCSPLRAETRDIVDSVLVARSDVRRTDTRQVLAEVTGHAPEDFGGGLDVQLWPHIHGTDAMFIALLRRD